MKLPFPKETTTDQGRLVGLNANYFPTPSGTHENTLATTLPISDSSPGVSSNTADTQSYGIFLVESPVAGIGFGGFLPPGAMCLLTPLGRRSELLAMAAQHAISRDLASLATSGPTKPVSGAGVPSNMPFGSVLLRAGEAISFGRKVTGMCGVFFNVWETPILSQNSPGVNPPTYPAQSLGSGNGAANLFNDFGVLGPSFRPYLRLFSEAEAIPRQIVYTRVPKVTSFVPSSNNATASPWLWQAGNGSNILAVANALASPSGGFAGWALVPPGTKHVTIAMAATTSGNPSASLIAGTSAPALLALRSAGASGLTGPVDLNVFWLMSDGVVHQHPGDQWTATGRGQLSQTHDIEKYRVDGSVVAVMPYVNSVANFTGSTNGGQPWATVICSED